MYSPRGGDDTEWKGFRRNDASRIVHGRSSSVPYHAADYSGRFVRQNSLNQRQLSQDSGYGGMERAIPAASTLRSPPWSQPPPQRLQSPDSSRPRLDQSDPRTSQTNVFDLWKLKEEEAMTDDVVSRVGSGRWKSGSGKTSGSVRPVQTARRRSFDDDDYDYARRSEAWMRERLPEIYSNECEWPHDKFWYDGGTGLRFDDNDRRLDSPRHPVMEWKSVDKETNAEGMRRQRSSESDQGYRTGQHTSSGGIGCGNRPQHESSWNEMGDMQRYGKFRTGSLRERPVARRTALSDYIGYHKMVVNAAERLREEEEVERPDSRSRKSTGSDVEGNQSDKFSTLPRNFKTSTVRARPRLVTDESFWRGSDDHEVKESVPRTGNHGNPHLQGADRDRKQQSSRQMFQTQPILNHRQQHQRTLEEDPEEGRKLSQWKEDNRKILNSTPLVTVRQLETAGKWKEHHNNDDGSRRTIRAENMQRRRREAVSAERPRNIFVAGQLNPDRVRFGGAEESQRAGAVPGLVDDRSWNDQERGNRSTGGGSSVGRWCSEETRPADGRGGELPEYVFTFSVGNGAKAVTETRSTGQLRQKEDEQVVEKDSRRNYEDSVGFLKRFGSPAKSSNVRGSSAAAASPLGRWNVNNVVTPSRSTEERRSVVVRGLKESLGRTVSSPPEIQQDHRDVRNQTSSMTSSATLSGSNIPPAPPIQPLLDKMKSCYSAPSRCNPLHRRTSSSPPAARKLNLGQIVAKSNEIQRPKQLNSYSQNQPTSWKALATVGPCGLPGENAGGNRRTSSDSSDSLLRGMLSPMSAGSMEDDCRDKPYEKKLVRELKQMFNVKLTNNNNNNGPGGAGGGGGGTQSRGSSLQSPGVSAAAAARLRLQSPQTPPRPLAFFLNESLSSADSGILMSPTGNSPNSVRTKAAEMPTDRSLAYGRREHPWSPQSSPAAAAAAGTRAALYSGYSGNESTGSPAKSWTKMPTDEVVSCVGPRTEQSPGTSGYHLKRPSCFYDEAAMRSTFAGGWEPANSSTASGPTDINLRRCNSWSNVNVSTGLGGTSYALASAACQRQPQTDTNNKTTAAPSPAYSTRDLSTSGFQPPPQDSWRKNPTGRRQDDESTTTPSIRYLPDATYAAPGGNGNRGGHEMHRVEESSASTCSAPLNINIGSVYRRTPSCYYDEAETFF